MNPILITANKNKLKEANQLLEQKIESMEIDLPEIQDIESENVAIEKAKEAYKIVQKPVLIEDVAFYINSWNRFPGALIKWVLKSIGTKKITEYISSEKDRSATVEISLCLYDGKEFNFFRGSQEGRILSSPRGTNGFGFDEIFIPNESTKTYAEMTNDEKNEISMRALAYRKLNDYLKILE